MMDFKQLLQSDILNVFMNMEEFGQLHLVDGKNIPAMIDDMEHIEREKRVNQNVDGIYKKQVLFFVRADDFGKMPKIGRLINLDGKDYRVVDAIDEDGLYSITLEANKS